MTKLLGLLALASLAAAERLQGTHSLCSAEGRLHQLEYNVKQAVHSNDIIHLDTLKNVENVECDDDGSRLRITFKGQFSAFWNKLKMGKNTYITGGAERGCRLKVDADKGFLMRRVVGARQQGKQVTVRTSLAQYDELYEDASISFSSLHSHHSCEADQKVCIGVNADPDTCTSAEKPLPVYSNPHISLTCDNCYAGFTGDVFFDLEIEDFSLKSISAGLRKLQVNAALSLDLQSSASWSVGVDKDYTLPEGGMGNPLLDFKIGNIPFVLWFEAGMRVKGEVSSMAKAEVRAGVHMNYDIGDLYVAWDPRRKWHHVTPKPKLSFTPTVTGSAQVQGSADFAFTPRFKLHANRIFSYSLTLDPKVHMDLQGDAHSKQVCETSQYDVALMSEADFKLDLAWAHIHYGKTWGPSTIWQKSGSLPKKCLAIGIDREVEVINV